MYAYKLSKNQSMTKYSGLTSVGEAKRLKGK
jgi:hypothetical protein